jgi:hypothetical protein
MGENLTDSRFPRPLLRVGQVQDNET